MLVPLSPLVQSLAAASQAWWQAAGAGAADPLGAVLGGALLIIAATLGFIVLRRPDVPFGWLFWLVSSLFALLGATHLAVALADAEAAEGPLGSLRLAAVAAGAVVAVTFAYVAFRIVRLPSPEFLQHSVRERTAELERAVAALRREVEQRRSAEAALGREREFLRTVLESVEEGVVACDAGQRQTVFNRAARGIFGKDASASPFECAARCPLYQSDAKTPLRADEHPLLLALKGEPVVRQEVVVVRPGEPPLHLRATGRALDGPGGDRLGAVVAFQNVTERQQLEERYLQAQKMEAIGRLAGGVAHDFNNLLTVINGYSELLLPQLPEEGGGREAVREILRAVDRAAGLTRQLLAFSRKQPVQTRVLDLNAVLGETEKMLRRVIGEDVRLTLNLAPNLWPVRADAGQVDQVVMNLAVNARDAMPRGGRLTIRTANIDLDAGYAQAHAHVLPGQYVLLSVTDTGDGIPPDVLEHVFEPFFTTKEPGQGTGLGLATVYGIVKQNGGNIEVYSQPGVGTSFKIYLPRAESAPKPVRPGKSHAGLAPVPHGKETILLVEDDEVIRSLGRTVLGASGYHVLTAADGADAMRFLETYPGPIDLLITDVVMPVMGGRVLARHVGERHPNLRVLFVSGYMDDVIVRHGVEESEVNFLQKPFSARGLAEKVREILDAQVS